MPDTAWLKVDGKQYAGWTSIDIKQSLDNGADSFSLGLTDRWAGETTPRPMRMGSACELWIDDTKIITGYVDDVNPSYDAQHRAIEVEGRSKVADLVDCSTTTASKQFRGLSIEQLAKRLCEPFGIDVIAEVKGAAKSRQATIDAGQRIFDFLEERARAEAVLLVGNADGNLVITRASTTRLITTLELGKNLLSAEARFSMKDRFSQYYFPGQGKGWGENFGSSAAHVLGRSDDMSVRYRPTVVLPETEATPAEVRRRAEWQRNVTYGRSMQVVYTVAGWRHAEGLWTTNKLVRIVDPWSGINDAWWLISGVRLRLDEHGQRTEITVMPKEAFDLIPLPPKNEVMGW